MEEEQLDRLFKKACKKIAILETENRHLKRIVAELLTREEGGKWSDVVNNNIATMDVADDEALQKLREAIREDVANFSADVEAAGHNIDDVGCVERADMREFPVELDVELDPNLKK